VDSTAANGVGGSASSTPAQLADSAFDAAASDTTPRPTPTQEELLKWVRRVPLDQFPDLPKSVRTTLEGRHCQVPTPSGKPDNVIKGAFTKAGVVEWAVLCSVNDTSQILVLNATTGVVADSTEKSADVDWVQGDGGAKWLFSQAITLVTMDVLNNTPVYDDGELVLNNYKATFPKPIDHDGIGHWFLDKAGDTLYCANGKWYSVGSAD
jgi:hypothetical protein